MARLGEFDLIERLFAPLAEGFPGALNLKDDAALVPISTGCRLVVTTDALVAGVHFRTDDPPDLVARKALRVNLSDLAAMGAKPLGLLVAACFPKDVDESWLTRFAKGLAQDKAEFGVPIIGGDTVSTPGPFTLAVTALGEVEEGRALKRSAAQAGDVIMVSGTIGDGALGLDALEGKLANLFEDERKWLADRYLLPRPRLELGQALAASRKAHAGMDISDGLLADLAHICRASGLSGIVRVQDIPLSSPARTALKDDPKRIERILAGGDDYELLITAPASSVAPLQEIAARFRLGLTVIGHMAEGAGVQALDASGAPMSLPFKGWRHF
ncbi:Thiamine-monophosphate kinase [Rhodospirillaceae bacterium LM-1]|nr:Thiamine-monophosphate kinase [Rhodospirillaceae bacterium LM-1]